MFANRAVLPDVEVTIFSLPINNKFPKRSGNTVIKKPFTLPAHLQQQLYFTTAIF